MKSTSTALAAHLAGPVTTLATCWRISRIDGREFFFTDHDRDLAFEGNLYRASSGYSRTAIAGDASLSVDNLDVEGVFDSAAITEEELRAGLFDQAEVRIFIVNWADPAMGALRMRRGWFGEVVLSEQDIFRTELRGMTQALQQRIGELYSPECRADLGDHRCKVPVAPSEIARSTAYNVGDVVRVRTTGTPVSFLLPIVNGSFEADGAGGGSGFTPTGWTKVSGDWDVHDAGNGSLAPAAGSYYLEGGSSASGEVTQTLDLVASGLDPLQIDADAYRLDASVSRANSFPDDLGRVVLEAFDGAGSLLATLLDTDFEAILPEDSWAQRGVDQAQLPAGTRVLRIRLLHQLAAGSQANAAFDAVTAVITDTTAAIPTAADYENRVYRCVSAGTTAATQPAFDTSVGAQTLDGDAVFEAEEAWTRSGVVTEVTDRAVFTAELDEPRATDDWFAGGVLTWETGANAGRAIEVKGWGQTTGHVELFLPMGYAIAAGDMFRIHPGCDKRLDTCIDRFANVLNFRGEPYVPGQDVMMRYPDAR
ncbi:baseplate hub protein [Roseovarius tibetensis]|uniref:baseplate hub domain-containing protein n=1 Tax=Roseovarius tibetensis TaxID=2685897 RepID=UPI003D7F8FBE